MRILDLYCKAGGGAVGYHRAGFEVVGVDIERQPRYPFDFIQGDALEVVREIGHGFDVIHASPPCQAYSITRNNGRVKESPDLLGATRDALRSLYRKPYVIENVLGAPMEWPIMLCGSSFRLKSGIFDLPRHRYFESNVVLFSSPCSHRKGYTIGVYGGGANAWHRSKWGRCIRVTECREAMGIDWMTRSE